MTFAMRDRVQQEKKQGLLGLHPVEIFTSDIFFVNKSNL
jgi:hypothetical protein